MAKHSVRVVEDGALGTSGGWVFADDATTGEQHFLIEQTAAQSADALNEAWHAGQQLAIEQAVREGIVEYREPREDPPPLA